MFDMAKWDGYLAEYCQNAERAGATPSELLELFASEVGRLTPRAQAEQAYRATLRADLTQYARRVNRQ